VDIEAGCQEQILPDTRLFRLDTCDPVAISAPDPSPRRSLLTTDMGFAVAQRGEKKTIYRLISTK